MTDVGLLAAGDLSLGGRLQGWDVPRAQALFADIRPFLAEAQLRFVSFDCAIGHEGEPPHPEEFIVDCDVDLVDVLASMPFDVVSLANNHSTDRGMEALLAGARRLVDGVGPLWQHDV